MILLLKRCKLQHLLYPAIQAFTQRSSRFPGLEASASLHHGTKFVPKRFIFATFVTHWVVMCLLIMVFNIQPAVLIRLKDVESNYIYKESSGQQCVKACLGAWLAAYDTDRTLK